MIPVTAAILRRDDGAILVCRRGPGGCEGCWEFPGGKLEPGETLPECMRRELREELNIDVAVGDCYTSFVHRTPDRDLEFTFFHVTLLQGEPQCRVHTELAWLQPGQMDPVQFCPADRAVVRLLQKE